MVKKIIFVLVTGASSFVFWWKVLPWINDPLRFQVIGVWLWPLISFVALLALMSLSFLLLPKIFRLGAVFLNFLAFAIFFGTNQILLLGVAVSFLFQFFAVRATDSEKENRLVFNFSSVLRTGIARLVTSLLILVSFAFFLSVGVQSSVNKKELPLSVQKTIQVVVGNYIGENLEVQNPRLKAETSSQVISQINTFLRPYFKFLPPILAFGLFAVLQGLSFVFVWLAILLAFILFSILKLTGLIKIDKKPKEAEILIF